MLLWNRSALVRRQAITWTNTNLFSIETIRDKLQWISNQNTKFFIHENAFENSRMRNDGHFA